MATEPKSYELFRSAERNALHLETRDVYTPDDPIWLEWNAGNRSDLAETEEGRGWFDLIVATVPRASRSAAPASCPSRSRTTSGSSTT